MKCTHRRRLGDGRKPDGLSERARTLPDATAIRGAATLAGSELLPDVGATHFEQGGVWLRDYRQS